MNVLDNFGNGTALLPEQSVETLHQHPLSWSILGAIISIYIARVIQSHFGGIKAPVVGFRSAWEPAFFVRLRFSKGALPMISEGYQKVDLISATCLFSMLMYFETVQKLHVQDSS